MSWKRFVGWVREDNGGYDPVDPGFGRPGGGWSPVDPGFGIPGFGPVDPGFGVGGGLHPSHGLPISPGHPGNKPPGRPIVPPHPGNKPPMGGAPPHPWLPGHWEIIDPGWGLPPLLGFLPTDPGFGIPETPPPTVGGGPAPGAPPVVGGGPVQPPTVNPKPPISGPGGGTWVPVDPDFGRPGCPGGRPHPPIWAWIPAPPDLSKPVEPVEPPTTATPK